MSEREDLLKRVRRVYDREMNRASYLGGSARREAHEMMDLMEDVEVALREQEREPDGWHDPHATVSPGSLAVYQRRVNNDCVPIYIGRTPPTSTREGAEVREVGPNDSWPGAVSDGLTIPCGRCGEVPRWDYRVPDNFWNNHVPPQWRLGVVCLPCLSAMVGRNEPIPLLDVQYTGPGYTTVLKPERTWLYGRAGGDTATADKGADYEVQCDTCDRTGQFPPGWSIRLEGVMKIGTGRIRWQCPDCAPPEPESED